MGPFFFGMLKINALVQKYFNNLFFINFYILETIAFSATWMHSPNINNNTVLRFDHVQLNEGDG